ncbi:MAG: hypothetical protein SWH61_05045 [Thermodesulfobacteriota bacterium]|nr:hypothetical protein [Thermodesulfobacteriota bacterium]
MRVKYLTCFVITSIFLLQGCITQYNTQHCALNDTLHFCLKEEPRVKPPQKYLLLPVDVSIYEVSAGGASEEVPELSEQGCKYVTQRLTEHLKKRQGIELTQLPDLSEAEQNLLDQHVALYDRITASMDMYTQIPAFKHKLERPDGTLGSGLSFLAESTGADAAIVASGDGFVSTGGRVATTILYSVLASTLLPVSGSWLHVGVVDLKTGNVLWTNSYTIGSGIFALNKMSGATRMVEKVLDGYPDFDALAPATKTDQGGKDVQAENL